MGRPTSLPVDRPRFEHVAREFFGDNAEALAVFARLSAANPADNEGDALLLAIDALAEMRARER